MFEKEIKFIVDYTLNKLRKEVAHVNMGRLLNSSIHPSIIKYCSAEIDNQIRTDRNKLLTNSFFDYSGSEISRLFNQISEEIKQNYKMKNDDLKKIIIKAVSFNVNYVVRPGWTLAKFIFNDGKDKTIREVLSYFNYVYYYDYQIQVLSAFLQKRKSDNITREEFILISSKIDKEVISSNRKEILKDGILSIADFFNEGAVSKDKIIPSLLIYYLKDKKFNEAAEDLKSFYGVDEKLKQPVRDIIKKLSSFLNEEIVSEGELPQQSEEEIQEQPDTEQLQEPASSGRTEELTSGIKVKSAVQSEDYQATLQSLLKMKSHPEEIKSDYQEDEEPQIPPVNSQPKEEPAYIPEVQAEQETPPDSQEPEDQPDIQSDILETQQRGEHGEFSFKFYVEEKKEEEPNTAGNKKNDIFALLSKRETEKITSSLFNDDEDDFVNIMDKIIECNSYEEASDILKKIFQNNRVNPYSKDAMLLTTTIANFFNQE